MYAVDVRRRPLLARAGYVAAVAAALVRVAAAARRHRLHLDALRRRSQQRQRVGLAAARSTRGELPHGARHVAHGEDGAQQLHDHLAGRRRHGAAVVDGRLRARQAPLPGQSTAAHDLRRGQPRAVPGADDSGARSHDRAATSTTRAWRSSSSTPRSRQASARSSCATSSATCRTPCSTPRAWTAPARSPSSFAWSCRSSVRRSPPCRC